MPRERCIFTAISISLSLGWRQRRCRYAIISVPTYYKWKSKYGGLEASELRRVKDLEAENARLKRMYAELALDNAAMKDLIAKKL